MKINIYNERYAKKYILNIINALNSACNYLKISCSDIEVNLTFVSKRAIKKLNKETRNINKVTDVLSYPTLLSEGSGIIDKKISKKAYPFDINPETGNIVIGDIVVCVPKCLQQSKKFGTTPTREICYLTVHGFLHLLGYDHINDDDKKIMREKEEEILKLVSLN